MFRTLLAQLLIVLVVVLTSGAADVAASALTVAQVTSSPWTPARPSQSADAIISPITLLRLRRAVATA